MRQGLATLAAALSIALTWSPLHAHHSHFYDECRTITIEGHVESAAFKNPHNLIVLRLDDGRAFAVDWVNVTWLTRDGVIHAARGAVVPGARLAVTGYLIRDAATIPKFKGVVDPNTVEARLLRRVDHSFSWGMPPRSNPRSCDQVTQELSRGR
jgi:hypothetical protein